MDCSQNIHYHYARPMIIQNASVEIEFTMQTCSLGTEYHYAWTNDNGGYK